MITLAVYGTLKRGFWNHDTYCAGVISIEEAMVRGRLYLLGSGIPILQVPDDDILAAGTSRLQTASSGRPMASMATGTGSTVS